MNQAYIAGRYTDHLLARTVVAPLELPVGAVMALLDLARESDQQGRRLPCQKLSD